MKKVYILEGLPVAWSRAGLNKATGTLYDKQRDLKIYQRLLLEQQHGQDKPLKGPLAFYVTFYMQIPKSYSAKKQRALEGKYHCSKPDNDNLQKFIEDLVKNLIIEDDSQIAVTSARKIYSSNPRTVFSFVELK